MTAKVITMRTLSRRWLGLSLIATCISWQGCFVPPRFLTYNNTNEPLQISTRNRVFEIQSHEKVKFVIKSTNDLVTVWTKSEAWTYNFPVVTGLHDDNLVVRVQIEKNGFLYILRPGTKFPVDTRTDFDRILKVLSPHRSVRH